MEHNLDTVSIPQTHELYGLLVENINDGVALVDEQGCFRFVNYRYCQMLGYAREEIVGAPVTHFLDTSSRDIMLEQMLKHKKGRHESFEITWSDRSGHSVITTMAAIPILDNAGQSKGILAVLTDVTKRKKSEEALKKSEANLRAIFNNSLQYFVLLDRQMRVQDYNKVAKERAKKLLNLEIEIGDPFLKFVVEEARADFNRYFALALAGSPTTTEFRLRTYDGQQYWVEVNLNPVFAEANQVAGVCFSLLDVNERKLTEEALKASEERYRLLVESSPDAILVVRDLEVVYVNAMGTRLLSMGDTQSIIGKSILDFISKEASASLEGHLNAVATKSGIYPMEECKLLRTDGAMIDAEMAAIPLSYQEAPAVQVIVRDIRKRKQAQAELLNYQQQLRGLASECSLSEEKERRRIATDLHDRIGTTLSLAKIRLESLLQTARDTGSSDAHAEIHALMEQALSDTRSLTFELSPPVLYELGLKAGIEWLADQIRDRHGVKVDLVDDGRIWPLDEDVRGILFRAVRELLINVVKHAQTDKATVSLRRLNGHVEIEVEDRGVGFRPSAIDPGMGRTEGFGLFSLRERMNHLGGKLEVDALTGLGTRVTLIVPLRIGEAPP